MSPRACDLHGLYISDNCIYCKGTIVKIPVEVNGNTSDGYHTFNELYEHRIALFIALVLCNPLISWRSKLHDDGTSFEGWFIAGMHLPTGDITYHLPMSDWDKLEGVTEREKMW
jgi:hypothetical protein